MVRQGLRVALKGQTPSARARLAYIMRKGDYAKGREGPRDDLAGHGSGNLPGWAKGRPGRFWRAVDQYERKNGRRCVELELNLPAELTLEQQHAAIRAFARRVCGPERLPYTYAIHAAPGNTHVHFMIQERGLDGIERTPQGHFKRASNVDPSLGGARKSRSITGAAWTFNTRCAWAETLNAALVQHGHDPRFNPHTKATQAVEALRAGDLRRYGELRTITERHEGPKVHGMRRRWERGELDWEQIPEGAQATIRQNDHARSYNNALRDWLRSATDEQLAERFGAELREQLELDNPSGHVSAWMAVQYTQALDEDRVRAVAAAQQAGELELLTVAQIEAAERAALAAELDELIDAVQVSHLDDLLVVERGQAHAAVLAEDCARAAAELAALVSFEMVDALRQRLAIEREQAHAAALAEDAERERRAVILDALEQWNRYLGDRPESTRVTAATAQVIAGTPGAIERAEQLARSLSAAEKTALERQKAERERQAAEQAERERQRAAAELLTLCATPSPTVGGDPVAAQADDLDEQANLPETSAPEPQRHEDEWCEYEENGELYRHPVGRPDEIYWQNPSGEWHLQPTDQIDYNDGYDYP